MSNIKNLLTELDEAYHSTDPHIHFRFQIAALWPEIRQALVRLLPEETEAPSPLSEPQIADYISTMPKPPRAG